MKEYMAAGMSEGRYYVLSFNPDTLQIIQLTYIDMKNEEQLMDFGELGGAMCDAAILKARENVGISNSTSPDSRPLQR